MLPRKSCLRHGAGIGGYSPPTPGMGLRPLHPHIKSRVYTTV